MIKMFIAYFVFSLCYSFAYTDNNHILIKQGTSAKQYTFIDNKIGRYKINTNYLKTHLILSTLENIETIKVSDELNDLGEDIQCNDKANLCQSILSALY